MDDPVDASVNIAKLVDRRFTVIENALVDISKLLVRGRRHFPFADEQEILDRLANLENELCP